ncbi:MAG: Gfo/Idh/MocA family oxidoreductase [Gemmatimonadaceae bacterium]
MTDHDVTRRDFLAGTGKLALGAMVAPRMMAGEMTTRRSAGDVLNVAIVGFGGQGSVNAEALAELCKIVAICDVDVDRAIAKKLADTDGKGTPSRIRLDEQIAKAVRYRDFREMLAKQHDIDGVVVATPDHNHAVIAKAAMEAGKHVYVQKPLTTTVHESRVLRQVALANPKLVTQMGNQGHSGEGARLINEWIQAGVIGPVHEAHVWTNRPKGYWPQGVPRPSTTRPPADYPDDGFGTSWNQRRLDDAVAYAMGSYPVPEGLDWDIYLGGIPEAIPYHPIYHPFNWRGWTDFGVGALGDMGAHLIDQPYWALGLMYPTSIEATSTPWGTMEQTEPARLTAGNRARRRDVSYPMATTVHYEFAARGSQPPVRLNWYDGGLYPPRPAVLPDDVPLKTNGVIFVGERGILMNDTYGQNPRLYPNSLMAEAALVPKSYERIPWSHEVNWAKACLGQATASSPIEYGARLTETMLLGVVALHAGQGRKLLYDGERMTVTNIPEANQYLTREYRSGWAV